jgi:hypothetical protein
MFMALAVGIKRSKMTDWDNLEADDEVDLP